MEVRKTALALALILSVCSGVYSTAVADEEQAPSETQAQSEPAGAPADPAGQPAQPEAGAGESAGSTGAAPAGNDKTGGPQDSAEEKSKSSTGSKTKEKRERKAKKTKNTG